MSLLDKLFGGRKSPEELREEAQARLNAIDALVATSPRKAAAALAGFDTMKLEPFVDFGAELHEAFAERVLTVMAAVERAGGSGDSALKPADLPPVLVHTDPPPEHWEAIVVAAQQEPGGLSFIRYSRNFNGHACVLPTIAAMAMMMRDGAIKCVFTGDGYALLRNEFLVSLADHWPGQVTERHWEREFDGIATGKLGCEECDGVMTPIEYEVMVYRAAQ